MLHFQPKGTTNRFNLLNCSKLHWIELSTICKVLVGRWSTRVESRSFHAFNQVLRSKNVQSILVGMHKSPVGNKFIRFFYPNNELMGASILLWSCECIIYVTILLTSVLRWMSWRISLDAQTDYERIIGRFPTTDDWFGEWNRLPPLM